MRNSILIITMLFLVNSCEKKKESCYSDFTYSNGNIKMSYHLKFNPSDTVYYEDTYLYGNKKGLSFFLLTKNEKSILDSLVCKFKFPKDSLLLNSKIYDGTTLAFSIDNKRLMMCNTGPKEFWEFKEWMDNILLKKQLTPIKSKVKFANFRTIFPPVISKE